MNLKLPPEWTSEQVAVFQRVHAFMTNSPEAFRHPQAAVIPVEHWSTTCWNVAWYAADVVGGITSVTVMDGDEVFVTDAPRLVQ